MILNKLTESSSNTKSEEQSDTSLVFRMKENRWIKPNPIPSSSEMDDK